MSDFIAFSEEIEEGMEFLEHHGVLGQKWGHKNGPPYPLGLGMHSKSEKQAAKAAGVKVGKSSGKGSIDKINKGSKPEVTIMKGGGKSNSKPKKEMTDDEKREAALKAVRDGDKKKITKYMDYLTTDELREAQARSQMKDSLSRRDPDEMTKSEKDKVNAMLSGDKETVRQYADKMTTQELRDAMNKVNLMQELNYEPPPPSAMDKLDRFMTNIDRFRVNTEKAINAYNVAAKIYNSTPGHEGKWPIIGNNENKKEDKEKSDKDKAIEALAKQMSKDMTQQAKETMEDRAAKELKAQKLAYKNQKKLEEYADKMDAKYDKKNKKNRNNGPDDDQNGKGSGGNNQQNNQQQPAPSNNAPAPSNPNPPSSNNSSSNDSSSPSQRPTYEYRVSNDSGTKTLYFHASPGPQPKSTKFNTNSKTDDTSSDTKKDVKYERKEGEGEDAKYYYSEPASKPKSVKFNMNSKISDYSDVSYDDIMDSYKDTMRQSYKKAEQRAKSYHEEYYDDQYEWMNQY